MPNPALKDHLLELRPAAPSDDADSLEAEVDRWALPRDPRRTDRRERALTFVSAAPVVVYVACCAWAMWTIPLRGSLLEILFMISLFQGPFLVYVKMRLRMSLAEREWLGILWSDVKELRRKNTYKRLKMKVLTDKVKR